MTQQMSSQRSRAHFGFAFLDAAAGRFFVGTATDDAARANLGAILTQVGNASYPVAPGCSQAQIWVFRQLLVCAVDSIVM